MSEHDVTKLPVWAQRRIQVLEQDVAHWQATATAGPEDSDTFVRMSGLGENDKPLGRGPTIAFPAGAGVGEYIEVRRMADEVIIRAGWGQLVVIPQAANTVRVRMDRT